MEVTLWVTFRFADYTSREINLVPALGVSLLVGTLYLVGATTFQ